VSAGDGKAFDILAVQADPSVRVAVRPDPPTPAARHPAQRAHGRPVAAGSSRYLVTNHAHAEGAGGLLDRDRDAQPNQPKAETVTIRAVLSVTGPVQVVPQRLEVQPGPEALVLHVKISKPRGGHADDPGSRLERSGVQGDDERDREGARVRPHSPIHREAGSWSREFAHHGEDGRASAGAPSSSR